MLTCFPQPAEPPFSSHSMGQAASDYYADDYDDE
jgi:hypothetical protein